MKHPATTRAGFGLLELLLAAAILAVFLGSLALTSRHMLRMGLASDARSTALELGATTLDAIADDLRFAGVRGPYPHLFTDGAAEAPFERHAHAPAAEHAAPGEPDHGPNRELVFVLPADDDHDGEPDFDANGALRWGAEEHGYALVTAPDGVNQLERRVDGRTQRVLARHVERVLFEDAYAPGFEVPLGALRVRLWFRVPDELAGSYRHAVDVTIGLRN